MEKYTYNISDETGGDYRIIKTIEIKAKDIDEADKKAQEELKDFLENINIQLE